MNRYVDICVSITLLTLAFCMATITFWITMPDTSAAKAPACVITGDGRGQKK